MLSLRLWRGSLASERPAISDYRAHCKAIHRRNSLYTYQDYLDSMEGATRSGLMVAVEVISRADALAAASKKAKAAEAVAA